MDSRLEIAEDGEMLALRSVSIQRPECEYSRVGSASIKMWPYADVARGLLRSFSQEVLLIRLALLLREFVIASSKRWTIGPLLDVWLMGELVFDANMVKLFDW